MRASTLTAGRFHPQETSELFAHTEEHRGWTIVVGVRPVGDRYSAEVFVRSPGNLSGTCIPHDGVYTTEAAAREAGLGIGCRWIDCHGVTG